MNASELLVLETLSNEAFVLVNKKLMRFFKGDGTAACFFSELISSHKYHLNNQSIEPDGSFPIPLKRYRQSLGLSTQRQSRVLQQLEDIGVARTRKIGFPQIRHVRIEFDIVAQILSSTDSLEYQQMDKAEFYAALNTAFETYKVTKSTLLGVEEACGKMRPLLRGTIILLSQYWISDTRTTAWNSETVGKITHWATRRALGKPFDFTIVTRALDQMTAVNAIDATTAFDEFINIFIQTAKGIQDVHHSRQVHEYISLIQE